MFGGYYTLFRRIKSSPPPLPKHCGTVASRHAAVIRSGIALLLRNCRKASGCGHKFLRCSTRLHPYQPHDAGSPPAKHGPLPRFRHRSISRKSRQYAPPLVMRVATKDGLGLMERSGKPGSAPIFGAGISPREAGTGKGEMNSGENRCRTPGIFRRASARVESYAHNRFRGREHHCATEPSNRDVSCSFSACP